MQNVRRSPEGMPKKYTNNIVGAWNTRDPRTAIMHRQSLRMLDAPGHAHLPVFVVKLAVASVLAFAALGSVKLSDFPIRAVIPYDASRVRVEGRASELSNRVVSKLDAVAKRHLVAIDCLVRRAGTT